MAQTPEKKVKQKVVKILKEYGVYYAFPATFGFGRSGVPDILCCYHGRFIAIECKAGSNPTTKLQQREIDHIRDSGGYAMVINEEALDSLRTFLDPFKLVKDP
jgi:Holliday junction resolvase